MSSPVRVADLDILCTDALMSLAYHLRYGKVDPERLFAAWNIYEVVAEVAEISTMLASTPAQTICSEKTFM